MATKENKKDNKMEKIKRNKQVKKIIQIGTIMLITSCSTNKLRNKKIINVLKEQNTLISKTIKEQEINKDNQGGKEKNGKNIDVLQLIKQSNSIIIEKMTISNKGENYDAK